MENSKFKNATLEIVSVHKEQRSLANLANSTGVNRGWLYKLASGKISEPGLDKALSILQTEYQLSLTRIVAPLSQAAEEDKPAIAIINAQQNLSPKI